MHFFCLLVLLFQLAKASFLISDEFDGVHFQNKNKVIKLRGTGQDKYIELSKVSEGTKIIVSVPQIISTKVDKFCQIIRGELYVELTDVPSIKDDPSYMVEVYDPKHAYSWTMSRRNVNPSSLRWYLTLYHR